MPAYADNLPTDAASKRFAGVVSDNGGTNDMVAVAGVNRRTQNGEVVADQSASVTSSSGMGAAVGGAADLVAGDDTGTWTLMQLVKRQLLRLKWLNDAVGDTIGAAVTTNADGTLQQYARGQIVHWVAFLSRLPAALTGSGNLKTAILEALPAGDNNIGNVDIVSSALPTNAATSALQTTGNTSLGSIDAKVPALGQALAAGSVPVVLPAAQLTTLTPPAAITGFATETTLAAVNTKLGAALPLPTGASTAANQATQNTSLASIDTKLGSALPTGATDDAAAAGNIYPLAGLFQTVGTVDNVDTGDVGRIRMSERRGLITAADLSIPRASNSAVSAALDMATSTSAQGTYAASVTGDFTWTAAADTRVYRVDYGAKGFNTATVLLRTAGFAATVTVRLWVVGGTWLADDCIIFSREVANNEKLRLSPHSGGVGSDLTVVPALSGVPAAYITVEVTPTTTATGTLALAVGRGTV